MSSGYWTFEVLEQFSQAALGERWHVESCHPTKGLHIRKRGVMTERDYQTQVMLGLVGTWALSGWPTIVIDSPGRLSQLATAAPQERPVAPWRGWVIRYPSDQRWVWITDSEGKASYIRQMICVCVDDLWSYVAMGSRNEYTELGRSAEYLRDGVNDGLWAIPAHIRMPLTEPDERARVAMNRIVLNSALALGELEGVTRRGAERGAEVRGRYPAGDYVLGVLP